MRVEGGERKKRGGEEEEGGERKERGQTEVHVSSHGSG